MIMQQCVQLILDPKVDGVTILVQYDMRCRCKKREKRAYMALCKAGVKDDAAKRILFMMRCLSAHKKNKRERRISIFGGTYQWDCIGKMTKKRLGVKEERQDAKTNQGA